MGTLPTKTRRPVAGRSARSAHSSGLYSPAFVDQLDEVPVTGPDDLPLLRTVGVCMALPEPEDTGDENAVRRNVAALVGAMSELAKRAGIEFVVEYREEAIGFLDGGAGDARVVTGFFGDA
jgi:hypothetical protein